MKAQRGFTLVEIAIVLVIIGLLLGGILKGQELINSARVRNLADTATGIQAAYYGFIDRYRRIPGDWNSGDASLAIGQTLTGLTPGGNDNGQIDNGSGTTPDFTEPNAMWVQLAAAGFIQGAYAGGTAAPTTVNGVAPLNAFNNVMIMGRTADFENAPSARLHLIIGRGIPVDVMRELDVKVDDGSPTAGDLRATNNETTGSLFGTIAETEDICWTTAATTPPTDIWDIRQDAQSCNAAYIF